MAPIEITRFCAYLQRRNYAPHTSETYGRDLRLFLALAGKPPRAIIWQPVEHVRQSHHPAAVAATTINRRLNALKHCFDD